MNMHITVYIEEYRYSMTSVVKQKNKYEYEYVRTKLHLTTGTFEYLLSQCQE